MSTLDQFRRGPKRLKLHPLEKLLLWIVALHLCFLPWALGTMHVWSQGISFGLSLVAFILSLLPRNYRGEYVDGPPFRFHPSSKLFHFPVFWLGLAALVYILVQALNPSWVYRTNGLSWWLDPIHSVNWLPSGMDTPFGLSSPWRSLILAATALMTVCTIWIGFARRRALHALLVVLVLNGVAFAIVGIAQKLTQTKEILWFIAGKPDYFFATIIYKNHAAAYLNLILASAIGLALWQRHQAGQRLERADPSSVFLLAALTLFVADIFTTSRLGMMLGAAALLLGLGAYGVTLLKQRHTAGSPAPLLVTLGLLIVFLGLGLSQVDWSRLSERFKSLIADRHSSVSVINRVQARDATWDMFREHPIKGWGAGSYRFGFPHYQQKYPRISEEQVWNGQKLVSHRLFFEYAHNDYVQCLAEFGLLGSALIGGIAIYWIVRMARLRFWTHPIGCTAVIATGVTAVHCWADFQLHNPANLMTLGAILAIASNWVSFERPDPANESA